MTKATSLALGIVLAAAGVALARAAQAQSLTAGGLAGTVKNNLGEPLDGVSVTVIDAATGVTRAIGATRRGVFKFALLPPGEYEVVVELIGFRPRHVVHVPVRSGLVVETTVALSLAEAPFTAADTTVFPPGVFEGGAAGVGELFPLFAARGLPDRSRSLDDYTAFSTLTDRSLQIDGLPGSLSSYLIDGIPYRPARVPAVSGGAQDDAIVPLGAFDRVQLVTTGPDVEWGGAAAGQLSGQGRRGSAAFESRGFVDWTGNAVSSSKFFHTGAQSNSSVRGGLELRGPVIRDTAHFVLGVEARRDETPVPAAWTEDSTGRADSLIAIARDSFGVDLRPYANPRITRSDVVTGYGHFDWQLSDAHALSVDAHYASTSQTSPLLDRGALPSLGAKLDAKDVFAGATLTSRLSESASQEFRLGFESSSRDAGSSTPPGTLLVDPADGFGVDPAWVGHFSRSAVIASDAVHLQTSLHHFKLGVAATIPTYVQTYAEGRTGVFTFGGPSQFAARQGTFTQTVGALPETKFTTMQGSAFLQDGWDAASGLSFVVGMRYDAQALPTGSLRRDDAWFKASGLDNSVIPKSVGSFSPRFGFTWDVGLRHTWLASGEAGVYTDVVDPALLGALITETGSLQIRSGVGSLAAWPAAPDSTHAPVLGPRLTLLGPKFEAPRSARVGGGLVGSLGNGVVLRVAGSYRHTDFLPRRHDLNRPVGPTSRDQYGRPIYGTLIQEGGLLAVTPGSNRRFSGFDLVSAMDPDGYSDYKGLTLGFEKGLGRSLNFTVAYTYSSTTDNWLSGRDRGGAPAAQLSPFPDSLSGVDWAKGRSDFDVPHRFVFAADFAVPRIRAAHVTALFRYRSGYPFTPGFRPGVDANGDGSDRNDPAFVDDTVSGMGAVLGKWECLRPQIGRFAERNSCREPGTKALDLRLEITPFRLGGYPMALTVDAINVVESDSGIRDAALYLVDPTRATTTNGATGVTTVPLAANPNFGNVLVHQTAGRFWRIGLRVNY